MHGSCPFCPGSESATPPAILTLGGSDWRLRLFPNKYPILDAHSGGAHEVLVESRSHDEVVDPRQLLEVLRVYRERLRSLGARHRYVSVFKNHGRWAGESIVHPHSQILATPFVPPRVVLEQRSFADTARCPVCVMTSTDALRIATTDLVQLLSPDVPRFAYEVWIVPLGHESRFEDSPDSTLEDAASMMALAVLAIQQKPIARSWNWSLVTAPDETGRFHWYIEIIPRTTALAGWELHSGAYVNSVLPEVSGAQYRS